MAQSDRSWWTPARALARGLTRVRLAKALAPLVPLAIAFALVAGLLRAESRVFYCPEMSRLAAHPCCAADHDDAVPALDETSPDCCQRVDLGPLPRASSVRAPETPAAPLVALVAPPSEISPPQEARAFSPAADRATGPPPSAPERCARTSVFLL